MLLKSMIANYATLYITNLPLTCDVLSLLLVCIFSSTIIVYYDVNLSCFYTGHIHVLMHWLHLSYIPLFILVQTGESGKEDVLDLPGIGRSQLDAADSEKPAEPTAYVHPVKHDDILAGKSISF